MNNILQLKGQFQKRKAPSGFGPTNLPKGKSVSAEHVLKLKDQLQDIILFWNQEKPSMEHWLVCITEKLLRRAIAFNYYCQIGENIRTNL